MGTVLYLICDLHGLHRPEMHNIRPAGQSGPRKLLIWPAKPHIVFILLVSLTKKYPMNLSKNINFGPCICPKIIWPTMRFELCTLALDQRSQTRGPREGPMRPANI